MQQLQIVMNRITYLKDNVVCYCTDTATCMRCHELDELFECKNELTLKIEMEKQNDPTRNPNTP